MGLLTFDMCMVSLTQPVLQYRSDEDDLTPADAEQLSLFEELYGKTFNCALSLCSADAQHHQPSFFSKRKGLPPLDESPLVVSRTGPSVGELRRSKTPLICLSGALD